MEEKTVSKTMCVKNFFDPCTAREIKDFKEADPKGFDEIADMCFEHYQKEMK